MTGGVSGPQLSQTCRRASTASGRCGGGGGEDAAWGSLGFVGAKGANPFWRPPGVWRHRKASGCGCRDEPGSRTTPAVRDGLANNASLATRHDPCEPDRLEPPTTWRWPQPSLSLSLSLLSLFSIVRLVGLLADARLRYRAQKKDLAPVWKPQKRVAVAQAGCDRRPTLGCRFTRNLESDAGSPSPTV